MFELSDLLSSQGKLISVCGISIINHFVELGNSMSLVEDGEGQPFSLGADFKFFVVSVGENFELHVLFS